ncbi:MAG: hypothetical protein NVSMB19_07540 [Vulcanimicrobiaceae bacterium]
MDIGSPTVAASQRMRYHLSRLQTAPQLAAVLDCLFDLSPSRTEPRFAELAVVDDRLIFARMDGEKSFRHYVGRRDELVINLVGFVTHLGFGTTEREYVLSRIDGIPRRRAA